MRNAPPPCNNYIAARLTNVRAVSAWVFGSDSMLLSTVSIFFGPTLVTMDAPAFTYAHVGRWLDGHVASRWPVCTSVIASMLGVTAANRASVVGKLIATAAKRKPGQDGAGRTEWRMGAAARPWSQFQPALLDVRRLPRATAACRRRCAD